MAWVALGGAIGAMLRFIMAARFDPQPATAALPWGTVAANVAASGGLGYLLASTAQAGPALWAAGVGFCGALSTYSSFAVQVADGGWRTGGYITLATVPVALAVCAVGFWLGS